MIGQGHIDAIPLEDISILPILRPIAHYNLGHSDILDKPYGESVILRPCHLGDKAWAW